MALDKNKKAADASASNKQEYSLNDDRRVKVLSPGAMVAKRFFRNRIAMVGLFVLIGMFLFSFVGGMISPYAEDELFYRTDTVLKEYAGAKLNTDFIYTAAEGQQFSADLQPQAYLAYSRKKDSFTYKEKTYSLTAEGDDFFSVSLDGTVIGIACKDVFSLSDPSAKLPFNVLYAGLKAFYDQQPSFAVDGTTYTLSDGGIVTLGDKEFGYISRYVVNAIGSDVFLTREFKETAITDIKGADEQGKKSFSFSFTDADNAEHEYFFTYDADKMKWAIKQETETQVYDLYSPPSKEHWLGTDGYGMDVLTRLMYGGRVSLMIGFIVEIISTVLGVIFGGISGYFGGWIDNLIMRIVDVFYCIPSMPIIIILGATMDATGVEPGLRMVYLMLILGLLGWPGIARLVRGQILSLREQEFMTATEACGISVKRRIFRHLIPNVIPQLIVSCTMGLGSTIITEATLSYLGLGVKFPFASWGNIITNIDSRYILETYWYIWIPAGLLLLLTVLAFNICGDGLRDAFDPKMKR